MRSVLNLPCPYIPLISHIPASIKGGQSPGQICCPFGLRAGLGPGLQCPIADRFYSNSCSAACRGIPNVCVFRFERKYLWYALIFAKISLPSRLQSAKMGSKSYSSIQGHVPGAGGRGRSALASGSGHPAPHTTHGIQLYLDLLTRPTRATCYCGRASFHSISRTPARCSPRRMDACRCCSTTLAPPCPRLEVCHSTLSESSSAAPPVRNKCSSTSNSALAMHEDRTWRCESRYAFLCLA